MDDNGSRFEAYIETAKQEGLVLGCHSTSNRICPNDPMTRGEMVLMLARRVPSPTTIIFGGS
ncbi:MAG TPA: hypothetical protein VF115_13235 [Acidimicrobiia bacterium]